MDVAAYRQATGAGSPGRTSSHPRPAPVLHLASHLPSRRLSERASELNLPEARFLSRSATSLPAAQGRRLRPQGRPTAWAGGRDCASVVGCPHGGTFPGGRPGCPSGGWWIDSWRRRAGGRGCLPRNAGTSVQPAAAGSIAPRRQGHARSGVVPPPWGGRPVSPLASRARSAAGRAVPTPPGPRPEARRRRPCLSSDRSPARPRRWRPGPAEGPAVDFRAAPPVHSSPCGYIVPRGLIRRAFGDSGDATAACR